MKIWKGKLITCIHCFIITSLQQFFFVLGFISRVPLLSKYMASERLLLSEVLTEIKKSDRNKWPCLVDIQRILDMDMGLMCSCCKRRVTGTACSYPGCHAETLIVDDTRLR